jgi:mRNA (guanine-N7-)-methyltransferase
MSDVESEHDSEEGQVSETGDEDQGSPSSYEYPKNINTNGKEHLLTARSAFRDLTSPDLDTSGEWEPSGAPTTGIGTFVFDTERQELEHKISFAGNVQRSVGHSNPFDRGFQDLVSPDEEPDTFSNENGLEESISDRPTDVSETCEEISVHDKKDFVEGFHPVTQGYNSEVYQEEEEGKSEDGESDSNESDSDITVSSEESHSSSDVCDSTKMDINFPSQDSTLASLVPLDHPSGSNPSSVMAHQQSHGHYPPPSAEHHPLSAEYQPPSAEYQLPSVEYQPPSAEYQPPSAEYQLPSVEYQPPSAEYQPPSAEYQPPSAGYQPPSAEYQPPSVEYQPRSVKDYSQPPSVDAPDRASSRSSGVQGFSGEKEWDLFVSHSTVDKPWAREKVIVPLRNRSPPLKIHACYHYMPDTTRYDDRKISSMMRKSSVIMIGLSPAYLSSQRCTKEWQQAVQLSEESSCKVIVAAVKACNRPEPLKQFLYLDYIDQSQDRKEAVWKKLTLTLKQHLSPKVPKKRAADMENQVEERHKRSEASGLGDLASGDEDSTLMKDYNYILQDYDNPLVNYGIPEADHFGFHGDQTTMTDGEQTSKEHNLKEAESGSEEGEIPDDDDDDRNEQEENTHSEKVAKFYSTLKNPDIEERKESPIFHLRNFNNWVKSVLIRTYLKRLARRSFVLDLCCGKGGDLLKWKEGGISHLVCADIAETSVEQCEDRYRSSKLARKRGGLPFTAEFIVADCTRVRLKDRYNDSTMVFNLTSCQFSIHYSFESHEQAHMMLRNACECLRPGGYFIGTTVDSDELIHRLRNSDKGFIGNKIFTVTPHIDMRHEIPLFGAQYHFHLHGVVDLPEYFVHFPLFVEMLKGFNMELEHSQNFYDFFNDHRSYTDDMDLMYKMQAMDRKTGTMSTDEWEAIGLYKVFVFRKQHDRPYGPPSWDSAGGGMYRNASHRSRGGGYGRGGYSASEPHTHKRHKPHY